MEEKQCKATRNTHQKDAVWQIFSSMKTHPTADTVFSEVSRLYPGIGRATVYRILNSYVDSGLAIRVPVHDGADRFDITVKPHSHAKCRVCGSVSDVSVESMLPKEAESEGFLIEGGVVLYYGLCRKCRLGAK